ncbi:hypothetical protein FOL47_000371 [Perkinsus chesapeaki]|uniref:Aldehyde dehydrogenase domain-containing protein n=1 Tax=Perkinsus chesapeaki TaxID=330153 RepID=A0A7J6KVW3_PERCH|nr:hypothetical protein FOL47_000371 [Perkinsus chesapeaki]
MSSPELELHIPASTPWVRSLRDSEVVTVETRADGEFLIVPPNVPKRVLVGDAEPDLPIIENFIGGVFVESESGWLLHNINPATGELNGYVRASDSDDAQRAIEAAHMAYKDGPWPRMSRNERASVLEAIADLVARNKGKLAELETADTGKPLSISTNVDISRVEDNFRYFAAKLRVQQSSSSSTRPDVLSFTRKSPVGACVLIAPWNLPLYLMTWKIAPCIASGNTCVCKPTELASSSLAKLVQLISADPIIGPKLKGVINVVNGRGQDVGDMLCTHPKVKAISFTGGTATGRTISSLASPHLKKVSLELGGKNATICLCGSRFLIHTDIYDEFKSRLVEEASKLKVGDPLDPTTTTGPVVSREHAWRVHNFVMWALSAYPKARAILGGPEHYDGSAYYPVTILEGVAHEFVADKEFFGPVVSLHEFSTEAECVQLANATPYGLAGSIWIQDFAVAHRLARDIDSGMLWVNTWMERDLNTPFGGVKQSGVGREGGDYSMSFYTVDKDVTMDIS